MSALSYNGHDFSPYVTAELLEPAAHALSPLSAEVPGRAGAALLGCELPPLVLRVRLFLDAGAALGAQGRAEARAMLRSWLFAPQGGELSLSGEPDLSWGDAVVTGAADWDSLFEDGSCEVEFTCFDPVAYGRASIFTAASWLSEMTVFVGGTYRTWPEFYIEAAAGPAVAVVDGVDGARIEVERAFSGGEEVVIDCASCGVWVDGEPADADVTLGSDFFGLEPGACPVAFEGCASFSCAFFERWL